MIHILYTKFTGILPDNIWGNYLTVLPKSFQYQNQRYKYWEDRTRHLLGKILLVKAFQMYGLGHHSLHEIKYNEYGKPFISDKMDFNISHSGQYVVCAIGTETNVGIDIEQINDIRLDDFHNTMTGSQWEVIHGAENAFNEFFRFWAMKESIMKAIGTGLSIAPRDIVIEQNAAEIGGSKWYLKELEIDHNYPAYVASNVENESLEIHDFIPATRILDIEF